MKKKLTIALAGNPNAGKTSLFNQLTGARAHVGNYPGVTVEKKEGRLSRGDVEIHVIDLPGTYSLTAYSLEELVARNYILDERPDLVVDVVDASNLERNLYLAVQFMEIGVPVVIALNMMDIAESRGLKIDIEKLSDLLGAPLVPTVARSRQGLDELLDAVVELGAAGPEWQPKKIRYGPDLDVRINELAGLIEKSGIETDKMPSRWLAVKALEGDNQVHGLLARTPEVGRKVDATVAEVTRHLQATFGDEPEGVIADHRYGFITAVTKQAVTTQLDLRRTISDKVDMVLLNRLFGPLVLILILFGIYDFTFSFSETPVAWFEAFFSWLGNMVDALIAEGPLKSLIISGLIDGVGGVLGFVPLIAFMFFAIAILEDSGYMARMAFIMDRVLRTFGLHGNSVLSLLVGGGISGGCAVPGVMAARTLRDPKERLATILVIPYMNCGAKLPVFAVLIAAFFASRQAEMMFILTLLAWALALLAARILRWTVLRGRHTPFVMELPPYRLPTLKGLLIHTWERVWSYIKKAGTVILAISILMWALMTYPGLPGELGGVFDHQAQTIDQGFLAGPAAEIVSTPEDLGRLEQAYDETSPEQAAVGENWSDPLASAAAAARLIESDQPLPPALAEYEDPARSWLERRDSLNLIEGARANAQLRHSIAGRIGLALESITRPLGFDWRTNIALTGGFAAKEVIVSTLGTAYSLSEVDDEESLAEQLSSEPGWNPLTAFVLMLFVMMYTPCMVTVVTIGRETGWRWALFSITYTTVSAYVVCVAAAAAGRALGLGV